MHAVAVELHREVGPVVHDEGDVALLADRPQRVGGARDRGVVDVLQAQLEGRDVAAVEGGAQLVGEDRRMLDALGRDEIEAGRRSFVGHGLCGLRACRRVGLSSSLPSEYLSLSGPAGWFNGAPSAERVTVKKAKPMKTVLLVLVSTIASLLLGIEIAAYLTVPGIAMSSEGDALVIYDPEIGAIPIPAPTTGASIPRSRTARPSPSMSTPTIAAPASTGPANEARPASIFSRSAIRSPGATRWKIRRPMPPRSDGNSRRASRTSPWRATARRSRCRSCERNRDLAPRLVVYGMIAHHFERNVMPCAPSYYPFCLDVSHVA